MFAEISSNYVPIWLLFNKRLMLSFVINVWLGKESRFLISYWLSSLKCFSMLINGRLALEAQQVQKWQYTYHLLIMYQLHISKRILSYKERYDLGMQNAVLWNVVSCCCYLSQYFTSPLLGLLMNNLIFSGNCCFHYSYSGLGRGALKHDTVTSSHCKCYSRTPIFGVLTPHFLPFQMTV